MIRCVAIDDEPIALNIIQEYCRRYGDIQLDCFTSPVAGMECVNRTHPDIVFLDIEMNSHNGIVLAHQIPPRVCIIFTTAYSQYALDGFNADAVDFLHKPIFYSRFERAMEKARIWLSHHTDSHKSKETIILKSEHKKIVVNLNDIVYIEAMDNYVKIYRQNRPMIMSQITMKEMETLLPEDQFMRIHRSFIIAINAVEKFSNRKVYFHRSDTPVPVGRKYLLRFNTLYKTLKQNTK